MNRFRSISRALAILALPLVIPSLVQAQATRTWVSGVGDDANPGSRTAPCKTFAGAISKTAPGGEIDAIDPGGFGTLTITKAVTVDGKGTFASILAAQTIGITINATGANDVVTLRNLSINGAGSGTVGIRIIAAKAVHIENCEIFGFGATGGGSAGRGINDERKTGGQLLIKETSVRNNAASGIVTFPASGFTAIEVSIDRSRLMGNGNAGLAAVNGSHVTISNSVVSGNKNSGIDAEQPGGSTQLFVENCVISNNTTGIAITGGTPTVRISNVVVTDNAVGVTGGPFQSFNNNKIAGNTSGNALPAGSTIIPAQ